ncbi:sulfurase [Polynucleobacter sp. 15G-AUS-farblos]|uniref:MOSC domain-containing protein n=1 Tax=Polynucleobacter sp. 15G-AUS-farblos TaxID=2689094 RepID=UPI002102831C|nr:MOSC domain-containing protein [Polynucleobacter sp. 15G-AUS-farblos]MBU3583691.1 sulfurase [Polynucleobacter sp. 15G-AUS-farblos]
MSKSIQIQAIYIAPQAGAPMQSIEIAELVAGAGIKGDRYALQTGAFSQNLPQKIRHISLIAQTGIDIANEWLKAGEEPLFTASETRRNIVLSNITAAELNDYVGKTFFVGNIECKGVELCAPCQRPAELLNKSDFMNAFAGRGGLRAEVLTSGNIKIGDAFVSASTNN